MIFYITRWGVDIYFMIINPGFYLSKWRDNAATDCKPKTIRMMINRIQICKINHRKSLKWHDKVVTRAQA